MTITAQTLSREYSSSQYMIAQGAKYRRDYTNLHEVRRWLMSALSGGLSELWHVRHQKAITSESVLIAIKAVNAPIDSDQNRIVINSSSGRIVITQEDGRLDGKFYAVDTLGVGEKIDLDRFKTIASYKLSLREELLNKDYMSQLKMSDEARAGVEQFQRNVEFQDSNNMLMYLGAIKTQPETNLQGEPEINFTTNGVNFQITEIENGLQLIRSDVDDPISLSDFKTIEEFQLHLKKRVLEPAFIAQFNLNQEAQKTLVKIQEESLPSGENMEEEKLTPNLLEDMEDVLPEQPIAEVIVPQIINQADPKLPAIHLYNVDESISSKFQNVSTTPVPSLGPYGIPFPGFKSVHIFQNSDSTLKVLTIQNKPYNGNASINLHHVLFPNYNRQGDAGEWSYGHVKITNINVNGEKRPRIKRQKVQVHEGKFSPKLDSLVTDISNQPVTVSAKIHMPKISNKGHLYYGIKSIEMMNIILPSDALAKINDQSTISDINNVIGPGTICTKIQEFQC